MLKRLLLVFHYFFRSLENRSRGRRTNEGRCPIQPAEPASCGNGETPARAGESLSLEDGTLLTESELSEGDYRALRYVESAATDVNTPPRESSGAEEVAPDPVGVDDPLPNTSANELVSASEEPKQTPENPGDASSEHDGGDSVGSNGVKVGFGLGNSTSRVPVLDAPSHEEETEVDIGNELAINAPGENLGEADRATEIDRSLYELESAETSAQDKTVESADAAAPHPRQEDVTDDVQQRVSEPFQQVMPPESAEATESPEEIEGSSQTPGRSQRPIVIQRSRSIVRGARVRMQVTKAEREIPIRPPHEFSESAFTAGSANFEPNERYMAWSNAIVSHYWGSEELSTVYLSVSPEILESIASDYGISVSSGRAASDLVESVSEVLRLAGQQGNGLDDMIACDSHGNPLTVGFVTLTVLAAYEMRSEGAIGAPAYYARLAELLGYPANIKELPGISHEGFESAWIFVHEWSLRTFGRPLALASPEFAHIPYVGIPLTHVPLRRVDIDRLPTFFAWAGYEPCSAVDRTHLLNDLTRWNHGATTLTRAGTIALEDPGRKNAVLEQVAMELLAWDGAVFDQKTSTEAVTAEIRFDLVVNRPFLYWVVRRLQSFPLEFCAEDGRSFSSVDGEYYDEVLVIHGDGDALTNGFEWVDATTRATIRRPASSAVAFGPSRRAGLVSRRGLALGVVNAAIVNSSVLDEARTYLSAISGEACREVVGDAVPNGWALFPRIIPLQIVETSQNLSSLAVISTIEIDLVGGLKGWRNRGYLAQAPPKVLISGDISNAPIAMDGKLARVDETGEMLGSKELLARPGVHTVTAGSRQKSIVTIDPFYRTATQIALDGPSYTYTPLPPGHWTVIGARIGEVSLAWLSAPNASIARTTFAPVWAISNPVGRKPIAMAVDPRSPIEISVTFPLRSSAQTWAEVIYRAAVRHAELVSALGLDQAALGTLWDSYFTKARAYKKHLKSRARSHR